MNKNEIVIFENDGIKLEVNMREDTVWLSQQQMAKLFHSSRTNIIEHINNIYYDASLIKIQHVRISDRFEKKAKELLQGVCHFTILI